MLGERLGIDDDQLRAAGGFDHCWVLRDAGPGLRRAARLTAPDAGRVLEVWTTEPGIQVYTANQLDGSFTDGAGHRHERHGSVCLETQHLPDSPNRPELPSTVLRPGETARSRTELRFPHLPELIDCRLGRAPCCNSRPPGRTREMYHAPSFCVNPDRNSPLSRGHEAQCKH